jgi:hypothetical protein
MAGNRFNFYFFGTVPSSRRRDFSGGRNGVRAPSESFDRGRFFAKFREREKFAKCEIRDKNSISPKRGKFLEIEPNVIFEGSDTLAKRSLFKVTKWGPTSAREISWISFFREISREREIRETRNSREKSFRRENLRNLGASDRSSARVCERFFSTKKKPKKLKSVLKTLRIEVYTTNSSHPSRVVVYFYRLIILKGKMDEQQKKCNTCGEEKILEEFHRDNHARDGRKNRCKICQKELTKNKSPPTFPIQQFPSGKPSPDPYEFRKKLITEVVELLNDPDDEDEEVGIKKFQDFFAEVLTLREDVRKDPKSELSLVGDNLNFAWNDNFSIAETFLRSKLNEFLNKRKNVRNASYNILQGENFPTTKNITIELRRGLKFTASEVREFKKSIYKDGEEKFSHIDLELDTRLVTREDMGRVLQKIFAQNGKLLSLSEVHYRTVNPHPKIIVSWPESKGVSFSFANKIREELLDFEMKKRDEEEASRVATEGFITDNLVSKTEVIDEKLDRLLSLLDVNSEAPPPVAELSLPELKFPPLLKKEDPVVDIPNMFCLAKKSSGALVATKKSQPLPPIPLRSESVLSYPPLEYTAEEIARFMPEELRNIK